MEKSKRHKFYVSIRELLKDHYHWLTKLLKNQLYAQLCYSNNTIEILEIGPGHISVVLEAIEKLASDLQEERFLQLYFVDIDFLPEIRGNDIILQVGSRYKDDIKYKNINISYVYHHSDYLKWKGNSSRYDLTVLHNVLHELILQSKEAKEIFVPSLFNRMIDELRLNGYLFFGDPYYPLYLNYAEVKMILKKQKEITGHVDPPSVFISSEHLLKLVYDPSVLKIAIDEQKGYLISSNKYNIMRKLYIICLQKLLNDMRETGGEITGE